MTICSKYPRELTHYDKQLKRNSFRKLKENVWESKTKWQLMLKAQRSYHHKLISSFYRAWLTYTVIKLRIKKKTEIADKHFARKSKRKTFSALKRKIEPRWVLNKKLDMFRNRKLMKKSWNFWIKYVRKSLRSKEIDLLTKNVREFYLVRTFIELWFVKYTEKNLIETKHARAVMHHNTNLKRLCFVAWGNYHARESYKRELSSHLLTQFELKLKRRFFIRLKQYTQHKKLYEKHVRCVMSFHETYLVKCVLDKWNKKYEDLIESRNREKYIFAVKFHEEGLLEKCFTKLKIWSNYEKSLNDATQSFMNVKIKLYIDLWAKYHRERLLSNSLEEKAVKWRDHQLKSIYINKLMESFEEKRNQNKKIENFVLFCDDRLKVKYFRKWRNFSSVKKARQLKLHSAEDYYDCRIVRRSFRLLRSYSTRRVLKTSIVGYHNYRLLSRSFNGLNSYYRTKQMRRDCVNKFQERCTMNILRRAFSVLNETTKNNRNKSRIVCGIAESRVKRKAFQLWKQFHLMKAQKKKFIQSNRLILQDIITRNMIIKWWKKTKVKTTFKEALSKVKSNQDRRLLSGYFQKWMNMIEKFAQIRENCKIFNEVYVETILQHYILMIIVIWNGRRVVKEKENLALMAEKGLLKRRYFKRWVGYVEWKKEKLKECTARIFYKKHLDNNTFPGHSKVSLRRKQPMIPSYLREELFYVQEGSVASYQFSKTDSHDGTSPVSENLSVIYEKDKILNWDCVT